MAISERQIILTKLEQSTPKTDWHLVDYQYDGGSLMAYYVHDVDLRLVLKDLRDDDPLHDYKADWSAISDHRPAERCPVELICKSTLIENFTLVAVDSASSLLPKPISDEDLRVPLLTYKVAQIFDQMGNLDEYMEMAGLSIFDGDVHD